MAATTPSRFLLDTNILIHYTRGNTLAQHIEMRYQLQNSPILPLISSVTIGELYSFALYRNWGANKKRDLAKLIADCYPIPTDFVGIPEAYAEIDNFSRRHGRSMGKNDLWIAATANVTQAKLLTCDKDFNHLAPAYFQLDYIDPAPFTGTP